MIEDFFQHVIDLKKVKRKGWKNKLEIKNPESVADHSYSLSALSMVLADMQGLDTKKILKMALLHDLAESIVGDYTPEEISKMEKIKLENNAMEKILSKLPTNLTKEYLKIWNEFQINKTQESEFLHEMDKFEMMLQAKQYISEGHSKEKAQIFIKTANNEIKNKKLRELLIQILT